MTGKRPKSHGSDALVPAPDYQPACPACHATKCWDYSTNGDGATVQVCLRCGAIVPYGRFYRDAALGVRVIAYSMLSATFTAKRNVRPD